MTPQTLPAGLGLKDAGLVKTGNLIQGEWQGAASGRTHAVHDPSNGERIADVAFSEAADATRAVEAAAAAFPAWAARTAKDRSALLMRWYELIVQHSADLGRLMSIEQGKPVGEATGEVLFGASYVQYYAEEAKRIYGDILPTHASDKRLAVVKQPVGVAALITPWNFPSAMVTRKVGPALAAGCTVVLKPSEDTPLSALALGELALRAGIPAGVFNIVTTGNPVPIGEVFTAHPAVRKVSFTGSTRVGKLLMRQCSDTVKKVSLELGGNAPFIVFDDADVDAAIAGLMVCKYRNTGQTCISANRIYVQAGVFDRFADQLVSAVSKLKVANGLEAGAEQGPLINKMAFDKVGALVSDAVAQGGRALLGGKPHALGGIFYEPTVLVDVPPTARLASEEIFGPVAVLTRFETEEEVIRIANDTPYGLASYFYSRDIGRCWRVAEKLEAGIVGINEGFISTELAPFGGVKESGIGREGSRYGIQDFLEIKYLCFGGL